MTTNSPDSDPDRTGLNKDTSINDLLNELELSDSARAILTAYTGKMLVRRFRDLQDYAEKLFGEPVPLTMFGSNDFMQSLARKSEDDYHELTEGLRQIYLTDDDESSEMISA